MNMVTLRPLVVLVLGGLLFGCASVQRSELDEVRAMAEQAAADAAAAQQAAAAAQARADEAMAVADDANAKSADTEARIDQVFKKAMYK